jgi:hypothetical protein
VIYTINCGCHRAGTCTILDTAMNIKKIHTVNGLKKVNVNLFILNNIFFLSIYSSISRTYMRRPCLYVVDYHPFSTVTWCLLQKGYHCVCLSVSDTGRIQIVGSIYLFMDVLKHINHTEHINDML